LTSDGFLNGPNKASLAYRLFSLISDDSVDCRPNRRIRHPCLLTHRRCILVLTRRRRRRPSDRHVRNSGSDVGMCFTP
jgi:hypothetical protein